MRGEKVHGQRLGLESPGDRDFVPLPDAEPAAPRVDPGSQPSVLSGSDARSLKPDLQTVVRCVRAAFGLPNSEADEKAASWEKVLATALRYGVAPLVWSGVAAVDMPLPAGLRVKLRANHLAAGLAFETYLEPVLRKALEALIASELEPIVLKGGALAYLTYPEPAHRAMGDVDLLLPVHQIAAANDALLRAGFWLDEADHPAPHHLRPFRSNDSPLTVELHHQLMPDLYPYVIDLPAMVACSQVSRIAGVEVSTLAPSDALFYTCLHLAAAHRYRSFTLRSLVDILAMTTRWTGELDWERFLAGVERSRAAGAVYWPLCLSRIWLGSAVPDFVLAQLAPPVPVRKLVAAAIADPSFILDGQEPAGGGSDTLYDLLLTVSLHTGCSAPQQCLALLKSLFPPKSESDDSHVHRAQPGPRHAAYLVSPARLGRALGALARLLPRLARA